METQYNQRASETPKSMSSHPIAEHHPHTPAALYCEKYAWLMRWALHFCNKDRSAAEDLVQDVFMQMLVSWPAFQAADEPEKLLYTYLKYSFLLKCRKDRRYSFQTLSAIDFESLHLSLRRETFAHSLDLQDGLRRIVNYLNWRKQQTKAASVLLLRFIHGFFPSEIMQIAILNRRSVDTGLAQAREESKSYLAHPGKVQAMYRSAPPSQLPAQPVLAPEAFVLALRTAVFDSGYGECLPEAVLRARYLGSSPRAIECDLLAHIVSCRKCLNLVSRWCKLPSIDNRIPEEAWGFATKEKLAAEHSHAMSGLERQFAKSEFGKRPASNREQALFSMHGGEQRFRVAHEHHPKALLIAVDGQLIAARDISSMTSQLNIELAATAPKELIEVMSEQELPLLTLPVLCGPGEGPPCVESEGTLAEGQRVHIAVRFLARSVLLEVNYFDPFFAPEEANSVSEYELWQPGTEGSARKLPFADDDGGRVFPGDDKILPTANNSFDSALRAALLHMLGRGRQIRRAFTLQIGLATCLVAIGGVVFARWASLPALPAPRVLLQNAAKEDAKNVSGPAGVVVQGIRIQTKSDSTGAGLYRQLPRDEQGRRVARVSPPTGEQKMLAAKLAAADVSWDDPLSAANYRDWHDHAKVTNDKVEQNSDGSLVLTSYVNDRTLSSESITVRAHDFHPIARTVDFRDSDKILIAEVDYKVVPWSQANPRWFDADTAQVIRPSAVSTRVLPQRLVPAPTPEQLDEAELGVRLGLSEVNADGGERLQISRASDGIHVDGLVAEEKRKHEIVSRLAQVPHTLLNVRTFKEFEQQASSSATSQTHAGAITVAPQEAGQSPLERMLQQEGKPAEKAGELAHALFANSVTLQQSAAALDDLTQHFQPSALTPEALLMLKQLHAAQMNRLETGVAEQTKLLNATGVTIPVQTFAQSLVSNSSNESPRRATLSSQAAVHAQLCTELVSQSLPSSRAAQAILSDMVRSLLSLETIAEQNDAQQGSGNAPSALGTTARQR